MIKWEKYGFRDITTHHKPAMWQHPANTMFTLIEENGLITVNVNLEHDVACLPATNESVELFVKLFCVDVREKGC